MWCASTSVRGGLAVRSIKETPGEQTALELKARRRQEVRRSPQAEKNNGRRTSRNPRRQEGAPKVQAEDHSHLQEQGPETRPEGIRRRHPRHGRSGHRHHGGLSLGGLRRHGAE